MANELTTTENKSISANVLSDFDAFENAQRIAKMLAQSTIVPATFRNNVPDCVVALEIAMRTQNSPIVVMQNLNVIQGRPAWSSKYLAAALTASKVRHLHYQIVSKGKKKVIQTVYEKGMPPKTIPYDIEDIACRAIANDKETGEELIGPEVSLEMAVLEGWYSKPGSKWKTMPEVMLRYRAVTFFANAFFPELSLGLKVEDEPDNTISSTPVTQEHETVISGDVVSPKAEEDVDIKPKRKNKSQTAKDNPVKKDITYSEFEEISNEEIKTPTKEASEEIPASVIAPQDDSSDEWSKWED